MEYYKEINLPNWEKIQKFCLEKWTGKFTVSQTFQGDQLLYIGLLLKKDVKEVLGIDVKVKTAIMFINEPRFVQDMHIDGFQIDRANASNTALNLPILNCETGLMKWYSGEFYLTESPHKSIKYLKINWTTEPKVAVEKIINRPAIVKINIPHHIENQCDLPRLMWSVRFTEDIPIG